MRLISGLVSRDRNLRLATSNLWMLAMLATQAFAAAINNVGVSILYGF